MNLIRAAALVALALGACNLSNPGFDAPVGELAYPVAMSLSLPNEEGRASHLYVANSNFDLRYNGASVQAYDLDAIEQALTDNACPFPTFEREAGSPGDAGVDAAPGDAEIDAAPGDAEIDAAPGDAEIDAEGGDAGLDGALEDAGLAVGDGEAADAGAVDAGHDARIPPITIQEGPAVNDTRGTRPRLCDPRSDDPKDEACCFPRDRIDALHLRSSEVSVDSFAGGISVSPDGAHVYVPLRSQSRLLHLDVDAEGMLSCGTDEGRCQRGPVYDMEAEIDDLTYPALPNAVLSGALSDLNVTGRGRYFVATAHEAGNVSLFRLLPDGTPKLLYTLEGASAPRAVSLRLDNGFMLVASALGQNIPRIGARLDVPANAVRANNGVYLYRSAPIAIDGLTFDEDVRDVMPDTRDQAAGTPHRYYAILRGLKGPIIQSVAFLELDPSSPDGRLARVVDAVRVGIGLSKLAQAEVAGRHLLFASCYQDGQIHVIDVATRRTMTVIRDVLGPSDMQIDASRRLLYVTDFRASVIRVVDLHGLFDGSERVPRVVATLGAPYLPENVK